MTGRRVRDAARREAVSSHEGDTVVSGKVTSAAYLLDRWLPVQEPPLRRRAYDSYRRDIERHVVPAVGARRSNMATWALKSAGEEKRRRGRKLVSRHLERGAKGSP